MYYTLVRMRCQTISLNKVKAIITERRSKVVILGSGWGSYSVLKNLNRKIFDVKVVTPRNYFLFTPLLCSTTVGTLEFRSIIEPVRNIGFADQNDLLLGHAEAVDIKRKIVYCKSVLNPAAEFFLSYDILIIGVGCLNNTFGVPGVEKYACFLKDIPDARKIRDRILHNCEAAVLMDNETEIRRLLHTVIVGGGPTGVEFGAELYDFQTQDLKKLFKQEQKLYGVTLIESMNILGCFDEKLRSYAERKFKERPNYQLIKSSVVEVRDDSVLLSDGTVIPCGLVVWSTGLAPQPFTKHLPLSKNDKGQILIDSFLRPIGDTSGSIYALGDCAEIQSQPLPCTAQKAERQGAYLAEQLNYMDTQDRKEFNFQSMGMLAYIGGYKGLTDLPDLKTSGFTSWFLWRSAYLTRLGSWRLRLQVPIDWLKTLFFGRDTSRL